MKPVRSWLSGAAVLALAAAPVAVGSGAVSQAATSATTHVASVTKPSAIKPSASTHLAINCANASAMCTEVANSDDVFGHYVGHDGKHSGLLVGDSLACAA